MTKFLTILVTLLMSCGFVLETTSLASKQTGRAFPWNDGPPGAHARFELD